MNPLTVSKKKKSDAITKGAKIGGVVGALSGLAAKNPVGGRLGGTLASAAGGAVAGSVIGAGVKAVKNRKQKSSFCNNELIEFAKKKETEIIGQFPKSNTKDTKKKSVFDEASDKVKNKDKLPAKSDNLPENIKTGVTSKLLMRK